MVEQSMARASQRQSQEQQQNRVRRSSGANVAALSADHDCTLTLPDVLGPPLDVDNNPLIKQLLGMTGLTAVKNAMEGLMNVVRDNYRAELRGDKVGDVVLYCIDYSLISCHTLKPLIRVITSESNNTILPRRWPTSHCIGCSSGTLEPAKPPWPISMAR